MKDEDLTVLFTRLANCWKLGKVDYGKENAAKAFQRLEGMSPTRREAFKKRLLGCMLPKEVSR